LPPPEIVSLSLWAISDMLDTDDEQT
jgi:hypothetical protein